MLYYNIMYVHSIIVYSADAFKFFAERSSVSVKFEPHTNQMVHCMHTKLKKKLGPKFYGLDSYQT